MKTFLIFSIIFVLSSEIFSQKLSKSDSLKLKLSQTTDYQERKKLLKSLFVVYHRDSTEKAISYGEELIKLLESKNDTVGYAKLLSNIGDTYTRIEKMQQSNIYYEKSVVAYEKLGDSVSVLRIQAWLGYGYSLTAEYDRGIKLLIPVLQAAERKNLIDISMQANMSMAFIYREMRDYETTQKFFEKTLEFALLKKDSFGLGVVYNQMGAICTMQKKYENAIDFYNKAIAIYKEMKDEIGILSPYHDIGLAYIGLKQWDKAIATFEFVLKRAAEIKSFYYASGAHSNLSNVYKNLKNYPKALEHALLSKKYVQITGNVSNYSIIYTQIAEIYNFMGNYKEAYNNLERAYILDDSIFNDKKSKQIAEMQTKYETEKKEIEISKQKLIIENEKFKNTGLIAGFGIVLIILGIILYGYKEIRRKNKLLTEQKEEILSINTVLHQQKEEIIVQAENLQQMNEEIHSQIEALQILKDEIEEKNRNITASITYAKRIQDAILPPKEVINEIFPQNFVLYLPRDIVSGDFYWFRKIENWVIFAAADCTGHGVPGGFMSMLGYAFLNEIIRRKDVRQVNEVLNELRKEIKTALRQTGKFDEAKDGMDISLCAIDLTTNILQFSGAFNPLYLIRENQLIETPADKMPIGIFVKEKSSFTHNEIKIQKNDVIYLFSDGYHSQFGGENGTKLMTKNFKQLLLNIHAQPLDAQRDFLENYFHSWKNKCNQIDDVLVLGIKF